MISSTPTLSQTSFFPCRNVITVVVHHIQLNQHHTSHFLVSTFVIEPRVKNRDLELYTLFWTKTVWFLCPILHYFHSSTYLYSILFIGVPHQGYDCLWNSQCWTTLYRSLLCDVINFQNPNLRARRVFILIRHKGFYILYLFITYQLNSMLGLETSTFWSLELWRCVTYRSCHICGKCTLL